MDLHTIESIETPRTRADLTGLSATDGLLSGGTWLMSEPQMHLRRLIDLRGLDWPDLTVTEQGLEIAATCTIERLIAAEYPPEWRATPVFSAAARALVASFKIWKNASVGGNICLGFPAGAMISMTSALDAVLLVWKADGSDQRLSVPEFVVAQNQTALEPGDVLRSIMIPASALTQPTTLRKMAMSPLGRSGVVVIGRREPAGALISVTAATRVPFVISTKSMEPDEVAAQVDSAIPPQAYYSDAHGAADWRRHVTGVLTRDVVVELAGS
ncbi:FAD binding domain-containing protein [Williamsia sp.]|uniref:FAD binding domain-containing protein n=1 Tax=Williamsia sp. TaxID=1872085 RepID=UPI002F923AEF